MRIKRRRSVAVVVSAMLVMGMLMACGGCAGTPVSRGYDVLNASDTVYGAAMTYIGDQYKAGKLSEDDKDKALVYAKQFRVAWRAAQAALVTYKRVEDAGGDMDQQNQILRVVIAAVLDAQTLLTEFTNIKEGGD
ncbi:hypothetical protein LCGC14_1231240 [marine sediment metagenome]|uniref:Uncharacterized protein n=1 Tax=marine sediment metagenome TaxID=412755 RepID=A0A0F9LVP9_9ZZZZ